MQFIDCMILRSASTAKQKEITVVQSVDIYAHIEYSVTQNLENQTNASVSHTPVSLCTRAVCQQT